MKAPRQNFTASYKPMIQPLLLLDSGIGPRLTRMLFLRQKCESCYIEDVWNFRKTSPNHLFQCFTFIAKPMESCCKPSTTSRIVGERSPDGRWDHKRGLSCKMNLPFVFFHPRNQNGVSFLNASNQPSFFFQRDLNLNDFQQQFSTNQPTLSATRTTPGKKPLLQRDADLFGVLPRGPWGGPMGCRNRWLTLWKSVGLTVDRNRHPRMLARQSQGILTSFLVGNPYKP